MVYVNFIVCVRLCILVLFLTVVGARNRETEANKVLGGDDHDVSNAYGQHKKHNGKLHRMESHFEADKTRQEYRADHNLHAATDTRDGFHKTANRRKRSNSMPWMPCKNSNCGYCARPSPLPNGAVNVAWDKPAWQSSFYWGSTLPGVSCFGLDGVSTVYGNWFRTAAGDDRAFWLVDLQTEYTIADVCLSLRDVNSSPSEEEFQRNSVITVNGILSYEFPRSSEVLQRLFPGTNAWVTFTKPTRGRYVHIQKKESVHGQDPNDIYIVYAEVQIYVCPDGQYLQNMRYCVPCQAPCKYPCDNHYGCNTFVLYNVAMKEKATALGIAYGTAASTVDGRTEAVRNRDECMGAFPSDPEDTNNRFLWIEFSRPNYVYYILVQPRLDCCASSMNNVYVLVFGYLEQTVPLSLNEDRHHRPEEICYYSTRPFSNGQTRNFTCRQSPVLAYHVALQAIHPSHLLVCEVTVMGYPVTVLSAGQTGCATGGITICSKGLVCEHDLCKIILGEDCRASQTLCVDGSVCDGDKCSLPLNSNCTSHRELCKFGTDCDTSANFRCKTVMGGSCDSSSECCNSKNGYICDFLSECRKAQGGACSSSNECLAGASCIRFNCQCAATTPVSSTSGLCQPSCSAAQPCPQNSSCDTGSNTCKCDASYIFLPRDLTCVSYEESILAACQNSGDCRHTLVCQSKKCKALLRGYCVADENCVAGTVCENHSCRHGVGSVCDLTDSGACVISTVCEDGKCKLKVGENCSADADQCASSTTCSGYVADRKCLLKVGETCNGDNSTHCVGGAVCDTGNICRIKIGGTCEWTNRKHCQYHSVCDISSCRLVLGANCTGNEKNCGTRLTCDALQQCRIPKSARCKELPGGCLAGGLCDTDDGCVCSAFNTQSANALCAPVPGAVGASCSGTKNDKNTKRCLDPKATCDGTTNTCKCMKGFIVNRTNYTCNLAPGEKCDLSYQCGSGMTCSSDKICQIMPGESCSGHENRCGRRMICDEDEVCRWKESANCTSSPTACQLAHACDLTSKCKLPAGSSCFNDEECEAGTKCVHSKCTCADGVSVPSQRDDGCVPVDGVVFGRCSEGKNCEDPNAVCNSDDSCECREGYRVNDDFSCGKALGQDCDQDAECAAGTRCDSSKQCRVKPGNPCDVEREDQCGAEALCDIDDECKLRMNGNCRGVNVDNCKMGTFCDKLGHCRLDVDSLCNFTTDCPAGAHCDNGFCRCEAGKSDKSILDCEPLIGRVMAACNPVDRPCTVPGAACESGTCRCTEGKEFTQDFACAQKSSAGESSSWSSGWVRDVGLVVAAMLLLF